MHLQKIKNTKLKKIKYKITTYTQLGKGQSKYLRKSKKRKKKQKNNVENFW